MNRPDFADTESNKAVQFSALIDKAADAFYLHDKRGRLVYVNHAACRSLGYSREELLSLSMADVDINATDRHLENIWSTLQADENTRLESVYRHRDGTTFPVEINCSLHQQDDTSLVLSLARPINQQKDAEQRNARLYQSLHESEARFRSLIDGMFNMVQSIDQEGRFNYVNQAWLDTMGYALEDLDRLKVWDIIHPDSLEKCLANFKRVLAGENIRNIETVFLTRDGKAITVEGNVSGRLVDGRVVTTQGIFRDISERKQKEQVIQQQMRLLDAMERINRINLRANSFEAMLNKLLEEMLSIFGCDRAWLIYACDPSDATWHVPWERTRPEWPGAHAANLKTPMTPEVAEVFELVLGSETPVKYCPQDGRPVPDIAATAFSVQSQIITAIRPKIGKAWLLGLHYCAEPHNFTSDEELLFQKVGQRIADFVGSMMAQRELQVSEEQHRLLYETMTQGAVYQDADGRIISANPAAERILGLTAEQMCGLTSLDPRWKTIHEDGSEFPGDEHPSMQALRSGQQVTDVTMGVFNPIDNAHRWIAVNAVPQFRPGDKKPYQVYTTFTDITERRALQQQAIQYNKRLTKLNELTLGLTGDPLEVFAKTTRILAELFDMQVVYLSEVHGDELYFLSIYRDGEVKLESGSSPIDITPCILVREARDVVVKDDIKQQFPDSPCIAGQNITSYCGFPVFDTHGQVVAIICLLDDRMRTFTPEDRGLMRLFGQRIAVELERKATLQKQLVAEQGLLQSQANLAEAERIAHLGNWSCDLATNLVHWSDETFRIFGLAPQEITPTYEYYRETIHADDRKLLDAAFAKAVKQDTASYSVILRLLLKDGTLKYVNDRGEIRFAPTGEPIQLIGTLQDVTAQVKANEKLSLYASVVENTAEAVIITNKNGDIMAVNKAFTEITGFTEAEALGQNPRIIKSNRHDAAFYNKLWQNINDTGLWQGEIWNRRKGGEAFPAWSTISAVKDEAGEVRDYVSVFSDISAIKQSQEKLDFLAYHDPLTNLPNRLLFGDRLDHALQRAHREQQQLAILFLDLDRFKNINDSLGHPVGDQLLQSVAQRISGALREEDTLARLGGDEFIILVEDVHGAQDVALLAQKLMQLFRSPIQVAGHELQPTLSLGISLFPRDGKESAVLIRNADAAMYRAKEEGRNGYQFYTEELTTAVFERLTLETALRNALRNNEFVLHYQPQYALGDGRLTGAEALIRWQHPQMGLVSPDKFIPLAEDCGLIVAIGDWVLQTACAQLQQWRDAGLSLDRMSVNVSGRQFQQAQIVSVVESALQKIQDRSHSLELEITESMIMQESEQTITLLNDLKSLGVSIAIDDFGTGYSSLSYLKKLPVDKLKVDRSFVRDIPQDANDEAITRAVIALAQSLQLTVIAEGIETKEQLSFLQSLNCCEGQGYLYSRPLSAEAFGRLLEAQ